MKLFAIGRDGKGKKTSLKLFLPNAYRDPEGNLHVNTEPRGCYIKLYRPTSEGFGGFKAYGVDLGRFPWLTLHLLPKPYLLIRFRRWDGTPVFKNHF